MRITAALAALALATGQVQSQEIERGRRVAGDVRLKVWLQAGSVRLTGWDRDSLHVTGTAGAGAEFFMGGAGDSYKLVVDAIEGMPVSDLEIFLPRGGQVSVKSVAADISARDVTGWFASVAGDISLSGTARRLEAETLDGRLKVDAQAPWLRVRTGGGALELFGRYDDVVAATVSGPITINNKLVSRGRFESVTGNISYSGALTRAAHLEFDSHSGDITLALPAESSLTLSAHAVLGSITNLFDSTAPQADLEGSGRQLRLTSGSAAGSVVVRTFKGAITVRRTP